MQCFNMHVHADSTIIPVEVLSHPNIDLRIDLRHKTLQNERNYMHFRLQTLRIHMFG